MCFLVAECEIKLLECQNMLSTSKHIISDFCFPFRKAADVLEVLGKVAANSLNETGFFHHEVAPSLKNDNAFSYAVSGYVFSLQFALTILL